jgi:hypothetical protein
MENSLEKAINKNHLKIDRYYLSDDYLSGIGLNKLDEKLFVFKRNNTKDNFLPYSYNFKDIMECAIQEDGLTITHAVNSSMIGRAMAGGVLFGGLGAVAGAITGEKTASEKIYRATLSIVVDDIDDPIKEIDFLNSNMSLSRESEIYKKIYSDLNKWHKTLSVIIKRNESNSSTM